MRYKLQFFIALSALALMIGSSIRPASGLARVSLQPGAWSQLNSGTTQGLRSVHFVSESEGWAAGANATLLRTTNGGNAWSMVNTGADPARGFHTVRFVNQSTGWVGGATTLARTQNAGANWTVATLPTTVIVASNVVHNSFFPISATSVWGCGAGTAFSSSAGTLSNYSYNSSTNTISPSGNIVTTFGSGPGLKYFDLHFLDSGTFRVVGDGLIAYDQISDSTPIRFETTGTSQDLNAIQMLDFNTGWVVGNGGTILKYASGGIWMSQTSGTTANLRDVHFVDANRGWVVGDGGVILTTGDGGNTWMPEPSGVTTDLRGVFFVNANRGYAVGAGGVILRRGAPSGPAVVTSVSAASFVGAELSAESIAAAFGQGFAAATESATSVPLPTTLAGTSVRVRDSAGTERLAPLFFVAAGQINYQFPPGTANGAANISVVSSGAVVAAGTAQIATVAPGLFAANANGQGVAAAVVFRRKADGSESFEPVARFDQATSRFVTVPIDLGAETDQVFLIPYGTGIRFRSTLSAATCRIGGADAEVSFAGAAPGFVGLDQANVRLSRSLIGRGEVDVVMIVDGKQANVVKVAIK